MYPSNSVIVLKEGEFWTEMRFDTEYSGARINIRYLVAHLLERAVIILACMIVFAVIFTAVSIFKADNGPTDPQDILGGYRSRLTE